MSMSRAELEHAVSGATETFDEWGRRDPETNSMLTGAAAVTGGVMVFTAAPTFFVMGSVIYSLFSIGHKTSESCLKRWSK